MEITSTSFMQTGLERITLPANIKAIDDSAFSCDYLEEVYFKGAEDDWNSIAIGEYNYGLDYATIRFNCTDGADTKLKVGDELSYMGVTYQVTSKSDKTLMCTGGDGLDGVVEIPATIKIDGKKYKVTEIEDEAFSGNKNVTSVKIGKNVKTIGESAFSSCTKLKKVTIGAGVKKIMKNAFKNCTKLKTVKIKSEKITSIGANAFSGISSDATISLPTSKSGTYAKYLEDSGYTGKVKTL